MDVFEKIAMQQAGKEESPVWFVGEQLKAMCRADARCAEILERDLDVAEMSLVRAEREIKAAADKRRGKTKANAVCIGPEEADKILREFYGLPGAGAAPEQPKAAAPRMGEIISLDDYL